jgi:hypothetical protein
VIKPKKKKKYKEPEKDKNLNKKPLPAFKEKVGQMSQDEIQKHIASMHEKAKKLLKKQDEKDAKEKDGGKGKGKGKGKRSKEKARPAELPEPKEPFPGSLGERPCHYYCLVCQDYIGKLARYYSKLCQHFLP